MSSPIALGSIIPPKRASILFLKNIYPENLETIEEEFGNRLIEEANLGLDDTEYATDNNPTTYDKIPPIFTSLENWPKSTNILCWSCSIEFPTRPYFIPERIKNCREGGQEMLTHGSFCSPHCAVRYLNSEYGEVGSASSNPLSKWDAYHGVKIVHRIFTGVQLENIAPSPPKTSMKQFGGDLTNAQYRELLSKFDTKHGLNKFTMNDYVV